MSARHYSKHTKLASYIQTSDDLVIDMLSICVDCHRTDVQEKSTEDKVGAGVV